MANVLDNLSANLVVNPDLALVAGTNFFLADLPALPDVATVLREYGGSAPDLRFGRAAIAVEHLRVQVVCRGAADDYTGPRARAEKVYKALVAIQAATLSGVFYHGVYPQQAPFPIRRDQLGRWEIGFNVQIDKEPNT